MKKKIAIIGGGLAGISSAFYFAKRGYTNKYDIHIFEKSGNLGGLVSGKVINKNIYEYGPHFFHTNNYLILNAIKEIAGDILIRFDRTILIKFLGNYYKFPLSIIEVIKKLPKKVVFEAIVSLIKCNFKRIFLKPENTDSEVLLLGYYGNSLYELFFKNYIYNVWGIYPKDFSPNFAEQRIPKISASIFLNKIISPIRVKFSKKNVKDFVENVDGELFTTKEGYRGITEKIVSFIEKHGVHFHLNSEVTGLMVENNMVKEILVDSNSGLYKSKKTITSFFDNFEGVINTMPLNEMVLMIKPVLPEDLIESARSLHFRSIVFVGFLVNKPKVLPVSFIYFREHSFNRIYDSSYFGHDTYAPDTTILVAEISSSGADIWWEDEDYCKEMVIQDLLRENLITRQEILEVHVYKYKHGYPIYSKGYEENLDNLLDYISKIKNLETAGRQGLFQYINGHIAIQTGFNAAEEIIKSIESD